MKHPVTKLLATVSTAFVAFIVIVPFVYSPASCGCAPPVDTLASYARLADFGDHNADNLEAGLNRYMVGSEVIDNDFPFIDGNRCNTPAAREPIVCHYPLDNSRLRAREYQVTYYTQNGKFQKIVVDLVRLPSH